ncbi:MAG: CHAD domain-containing protein [Hyphomonadaceae bacterium]
MRHPGAAFDLRAALTDELQGALGELDGAPSRRAVHRCRVHLKRARALARVGRACAPGLSKVFNDSARAIMHALAQSRDLAALADTARDVAEKSSKKAGAALNAAAEALDRERRALPPLDVEMARAGIRDLTALAQVWPEASARQIKRGALRIARRARWACHDGHGAKEPSQRHEWRKREKDRLYAAALLGKSWPDGRARRLKRSEALGEALGRERDLLLLIDRIEHRPDQAGEHVKRALKVLSKRRRTCAKRADALGARLHAGGA